jgi:hypothetical protein
MGVGDEDILLLGEGRGTIFSFFLHGDKLIMVEVLS